MLDTNCLSQQGSNNFLDDEKLHRNLFYGISALQAMCDYLECCTNSIIRTVYKPSIDKMRKHHDPSLNVKEKNVKGLLKKSFKCKIKQMVKESCLSVNPASEHKSLWNRVIDTINIRNEIVHYKANFMQESAAPTPSVWLLNNSLSALDECTQYVPRTQNIGNQFTRSAMQTSWHDIQELIGIIAEYAGCMIKPDTHLVEADARDGFASYIVDKRAFYSMYPEGIRTSPLRN